ATTSQSAAGRLHDRVRRVVIWPPLRDSSIAWTSAKVSRPGWVVLSSGLAFGGARMRWIRRILAVVVGLPVLCGIVLFLGGFREGAGRNVARVEIARPPAAVFRHLEEPALLRRWTGMTELASLTPVPVRKGSRLRVVSQARGQHSEMLSEVTAVERDARIAVVARTVAGSPAGFAQSATYALEDRNGRSVLTVTVDTRYDGFLLRLLEP